MSALGTKFTFLWNPQEVCFSLVSGQRRIRRREATKGQNQSNCSNHRHRVVFIKPDTFAAILSSGGNTDGHLKAVIRRDELSAIGAFQAKPGLVRAYTMNGDVTSANREINLLKQRLESAPEGSILKNGLRHSLSLSLFSKAIVEGDVETARAQARFYADEGQYRYAVSFLLMIDDPLAVKLLDKAQAEPPWP